MARNQSRMFAATALAATGVVLAACSSSSPVHTNTPSASAKRSTAPPAHTGAPPATAASACELVTETEIGTALGADPGPGSKFTSHGSSQCQFGSYQTKFVLVNLTPTRGRAGYDLMDHNSKLHNAADLSGVGDRAREVSGPGTAGIYFTEGDALVVITVVIHAAGAPPSSQAIALAKIAASRL